MSFDFVCPNEAERARYGDIVSHGFGFPAADSVMWFERAGHENLRVIRENGRVLGGLIGVPMGQFFGGKSVRMIGVSGVGIAPHERGRNVGTRMMRAFEEDSKRAGYALSTLYGATHTLYERAGFFRAALQCKFKVDARMLQSMNADTAGTTLEEAAGLSPELHALYNEMSRDRPGFLDRGPYQWRRIVEPRGMTTKTWVARERGAPVGYVVLATKVAEGSIETQVTVLDMVASTRASAHAILNLLGSYASVARYVTWQGGPADPFVALLPERHVTSEIAWQSLTQLVDPARAIASRAYPRHVQGAIDFELTCARLGLAETSSHRLSIEGSSGMLTQSTNAPSLAITERGMVALYTGFLTAKQLVHLGEIERRDPMADGAVEFLCDAFAGPTPGMADHF